MNIKKHIEELKDYELKTLTKKLGLKNPGNKSNKFLQQYLLEREQELEPLLNEKADLGEKVNDEAKSNVRKLKLRDFLPAFLFFVLTFLIGMWYRYQDSPKPIMNDNSTTHISLVQDFENGRLLTLTHFDKNDPNFEKFSNYSQSISWIDNIPIRMDFFELNLKEKLSKQDSDVIYDIIEYSLWRWMMDMPQSYIIINKYKRKGIKNTKSGSVIDITKPEIIDIPVPTNGNKIIEIKQPQILLPKGSKFYKKEGIYIIETKYSILRFCVPSIGMTNFDYSENSFSQKIYRLFGLDDNKQYFQINTEIFIDYQRLNNDIDNEAANFEYKWFKRLKADLELDFGFEAIKNKISQIE